MPNSREMTLGGDLGNAGWLVNQLSGHEILANTFEYEVSLLNSSPDFDISTLVGDTMTVVVDVEDAQPRYFNGYVTRMALTGTFDNFAKYDVTLRPWFHLLSARTNSRIFQSMSVPDIAKALFREHGFSDFEDALSGSYPAREFVVQYRESDFNFVSRLFEHAGIYYYFRHEQDRHVLILADSASAHHTVPGYEEVPFHPEGAPVPISDEFLNRWELVHQWRPGAYASNDFDFERPRADLTAQLQANARHKKGDLEVFDYPGGHTAQGDIESYVRGRLEALQSDVEIGHGSGDIRGLGAGNLFGLIDFPSESQNKQYLIVAASFDAANNSHQAGAVGGGHFQSSFTVMDSQVPFRPALLTPRTRVTGPQTAVVVGQGEIWTDKYGRVQVQFPWDRETKGSCWVRVAQVWAGAKWGGMHIPRVGQEVIVDFLEGDPDRPIITGRVYNADNMPPYDLPGNATQSGIKSRSSKGGSPANFNELRFEDKKGSEQVYAQAEKDLETLVKNDEHRAVNHDRKTDITNDETVNVGHNRTEAVTGDEAISIGGSRTETVAKQESVTVGASRSLTVAVGNSTSVGAANDLSVGGADSTTVGAAQSVSVGGSQSVSVGGSQSISAGGSQSVDVGKDQSVSVAGARTLDVAKDETVSVAGKRTVSISKDDILEVTKKLSINVTDEISITTGDASISMKKNGDITIKGKNITLEGSGKINVNASGDVILKGSKIAQN